MFCVIHTHFSTSPINKLGRSPESSAPVARSQSETLVIRSAFISASTPYKSIPQLGNSFTSQDRYSAPRAASFARLAATNFVTCVSNVVKAARTSAVCAANVAKSSNCARNVCTSRTNCTVVSRNRASADTASRDSASVVAACATDTLVPRAVRSESASVTATISARRAFTWASTSWMWALMTARGAVWRVVVGGGG